jgi:hypothetical protein
MSATITWVIEWMSVKPTEGTLTDVVVTAGWRCSGAETAGTPAKAYADSIYGAASFPMPEGTFTPYDQLTQEQVLGWVWASGVDKTATEASVQTSIDNAISPPVVQLPLPWVTPAA